MLSMTTKKREAPSAERNKEPIWNVLQSKVLPQNRDSVQILEVAGGAGVHMHHLALQLMQQSNTVSYYYQPTDLDPSSLESQQAYVDELPTSKNPNVVVASPLQLTLDEQGIQEEPTIAELSKQQPWDIIININMIHISPWSATLGLMKMAGMYLRPGGILYLYGPYRVNGTCVESNLKFEEWLHSLDPGYGVRDLEKVVEAAEAQGLVFVETVEMPANNLSVILRKKVLV